MKSCTQKERHKIKGAKEGADCWGSGHCEIWPNGMEWKKPIWGKDLGKKGREGAENEGKGMDEGSEVGGGWMEGLI
jgi:hypothetical protein